MHGAIYFIIFVFIRIVTQDLKFQTYLNYYNNEPPSKLYDIGFKYIPMMKFLFQHILIQVELPL